MARILIVDDDEDMLGLTAAYLRRASHEVQTATDGAQGLAMALESRPDLVVLDLAMPRMLGFEVCQRIRQTPGMSSTPIVVTSGKNYAFDKRAALDLGADAYVVKPYSLKDLSERISALLKPA